jgi:hypothetical protein
MEMISSGYKQMPATGRRTVERKLSRRQKTQRELAHVELQQKEIAALTLQAHLTKYSA